MEKNAWITTDEFSINVHIHELLWGKIDNIKINALYI